jgi:hypothetical protein
VFNVQQKFTSDILEETYSGESLFQEVKNIRTVFLVAVRWIWKNRNTIFFSNKITIVPVSQVLLQNGFRKVEH